MPRKEPRDYQQERADYHGKPEQMERNRARKKARYELEKEGKVKKGDGKHVDHKKPLAAGGSNARSNLRVVDAKTNRRYKRDENSKPLEKQK